MLFLVVAPGVVAGLIPHVLSGWGIGPPFLGVPALRWLGTALIVAGAAALLECFARFAFWGRGTPAPVAPTTTLVVSGLYRFVRNPMYIAVVAIILGQSLLFGSLRLLAYAAVVGALFHLWVLAYEEPTLRRRFGADYAAYEAHVRRWWPRVRP